MIPVSYTHLMMQAITQWLQFHLVDDLVDKCKLKEQLSLLAAHTTPVSYTHLPTEGALLSAFNANMNVPKTPASEEEWNEIKRFLRPVMISLVTVSYTHLYPAR